jgi:CPA2 family monovalent cation:H+ antiporter-2
MLEKFLLKADEIEEKEEDFEDAGGRVLIIGFGRFGQIVSQPVFAAGMDVTILDYDSAHIKDAEKLGFRVHYGDGSRRDVLRAAGGDHFEFIIVTTKNPDVTDNIVSVLKQEFDQAKIFARSYDRRHSIRLLHSNVEYSVRETFESALLLGRKVIEASGVNEDDADDKIADVRRRDIERLMLQAEGDYYSVQDWLHVKPVKKTPKTESQDPKED